MAESHEARLEALEAKLEAIAARLERLERRTGIAAPAIPPAPVAQPGAPGLARRVADRDVRSLDLEDLVGGRVLGWVGGSAVLLGIVFFLVMAVSRGWIDEPTRVVLAFAGSTALLAAGLWLYERGGRTQAALAAVGAAIGGLYASLTAATALYELVSPVAGLGVAALVGATATAIAVRWDSRVVAGLGIVGALLAPVLVDAGTSGAALAFMAVALVSAVAVLLWRRWDWLGAAAFLVSFPQLASWAADDGNAVWLVLFVLALFWALYVVAAVGYELRVPTERLRASSALLILADVAAIAALGYFVLDDRGYPNGATAWILGLAAIQLAIGVAAHERVASRDFGGLLLALAVGLSGVGFALALDGPALVTGWAAHAAALGWLAGKYADRRATAGALVFLVLAYAHVLLIEAPLASLRTGVEDLADALLALAVLALASFAISLLATDDLLPRWALQALGGATLVYLVSVAIVDTLGVARDGTPEQDGQVVLSAFWSLLGLASLVYGLVRDDRRFRLAGLGLLSIAVVKVFFYDLAELESIYRVLSFIALGLLLLAGAFAYQRIRLTVRQETDGGTSG